MSTYTTLNVRLRAQAAEDAERYVRNTCANESQEVQDLQRYYSAQIEYLQLLRSEVSDNEADRLQEEIFELEEVRDEKIEKAQKAQKGVQAPQKPQVSVSEEVVEKAAENTVQEPEVVTKQAAAVAAARAAYAQGIQAWKQKHDRHDVDRQPWETQTHPPTPSGVKVWNKQERDELRSTTKFRNRNALWNQRVPGSKITFHSPRRIGMMTELISKARPATHNEWFNYYVTKVMPWTTIEAQAMEFYEFIKKSGFTVNKDEALAEWLIHVIDQTWEGWKREDAAALQLSAGLGVKIGRPSETIWDTDFGIDLVKVDENAEDGFTEGYQVKPGAFFNSMNKGVVWARQQNISKHWKAEALGKKAWFVDGDELAKGKIRLIHWREIQD